MRKITILVIIMMMLFCAANAEFQAPLEMNTPVSVDINGDDNTQQAWMQMVGTEDDSILMLVIVGSDGGINTYSTSIRSCTSAGFHDLNGDGRKEILISGHEEYTDYATWCFSFEDEILKPIEFPKFDRSGIYNTYSSYGYGKIVSCGDGRLTIAGTQDILGTWQAARTLILKDGRFEFDDDGMFTILNEADEDTDVWEYRSLHLIRPLPVTFADQTKGQLEPGTKLIIEKSDLKTIVYFITNENVRGWFEIDCNTPDNWGVNINGVFEDQYFSDIPYAN